MNILIIENFWLGVKKLKVSEKILHDSFSILPSLYTREMAAITPKEHIVTFVNERYTSIDFDEKYDIVLVNFNISSIQRAYEIADIFRKKGITVVISGWYASAMPDDAKKHADSIIIGINETIWLELLKDFEKNKLKPFYTRKGFDKKIKIPPTNVFIPGFVITGAIEATRGCPYRCDFCPESNLPGGSDFFARPVDEVVNEIKSLKQKTFKFYDNSLTINPKYSKSLFKKMVGLNKKFFCNGNSDVLARDIELVRLSKKAGCVSWLVGFESFSEDTLKDVGKKTNKVAEYKKVVKNIHDNGMAVIGSFMFGFDNDDKDVFDKTLNMIKELEIDIADFCILTPFPGTPIFNKLDSEGRIFSKDWSKYDMGNVVFSPKNMTPEELLTGVKKMYVEFYSTSYTVRRIIRSIRLGFFPFFLVLVRNAISNMNARYIKK